MWTGGGFQFIDPTIGTVDVPALAEHSDGKSVHAP
jgi:hypothetical protein